MAARRFRLEVVTPDKVALSRDVESVIVPAADGYLGIMAGHEPLVAKLVTGAMRVRDGSQVVTLAVSEGYLEVTGNRVVVLAEAAELPEEIDVERALRAEKEAAERLARAADEETYFRARAAFRRASNRLKVAETKKERGEGHKETKAMVE